MSRSSFSLAAAALAVACAMPVSTAAAQADSTTKPAVQADTTPVVSLAGARVVRVDTIPQSEGPHVSAVLTSGTDSITALIAPAQFLASKSLLLASGDVIDLVAARVNKDGAPMLVATEIRKGDVVLTLRDKATGAPAWPKEMGADRSR